MGKHERQLIKEAELIVVKILNSEELSPADHTNSWLPHAIAMAEVIKNDFPRITRAAHLGNRYDNSGDIKIFDGKEHILEIKMSDSARGKGTKANIGQDALTLNDLFTGDVKSWSAFRKEKHHSAWVRDLLDTFTLYPDKFSHMKDSTALLEDKARHLRQLKNGNSSAGGILRNI